MKKLTLESMFSDGELDANCPVCQHKFIVKFKDVVKDKSIVTCPECKQDIELIHEDTTKKTLKDSSKALKEFEKAFKKLGR